METTLLTSTQTFYEVFLLIFHMQVEEQNWINIHKKTMT